MREVRKPHGDGAAHAERLPRSQSRRRPVDILNCRDRIEGRERHFYLCLGEPVNLRGANVVRRIEARREGVEALEALPRIRRARRVANRVRAIIELDFDDDERLAAHSRGGKLEAHKAMPSIACSMRPLPAMYEGPRSALSV